MNVEKRHVYDYEVDLTGQNAAVYVMQLVGQSKRVLEIGCGPGSITKLLVRHGQCSVTALELDADAIKMATPYCERIIQADLNSDGWLDLLDQVQPFDVVVAADVLEHLYDPWITLKHMTTLIGPNGYVVVSLPHAGHAGVLSSLVNSDFEYHDCGLLDRTHIRFFGLRNVEALFAQAGLKIIEARYVIIRPEDTEFSSNWLSLSTTLKDEIKTSAYANVYQVVVKAVPLSYPGDAIRLVQAEQSPLITASLMEKPVRAFTEPGAQTSSTQAPEGAGHQYMTSSDKTSSREKEIPASEHPAVPRLIAFYLTQFHPTPENDQWWGKGFTEWTNVTKAEPLFEGHLQPHLPTDFGFYDLRVRETRREQIKVAKQYGIDGFCYHYYWFSGKRLLHLPLDDMLADPESDMPFCLCWANENWTRRWDGAEQELLIAQEYRQEDDLNFIKSLIPFFQDKRYIRVEGKPYFCVYRPPHLPDIRKSIGIWRDYCRTIGLGEIHIGAALTHQNEEYAQFGFDSGVQFPPHNLYFANINDQIKFFNTFRGNLLQYETIAQSYLERTYTAPRVFKTVFPSWDNTARTKDRALVVLNGTPDNYEHWLGSAIDLAMRSDEKDELIFINAWNEWAEGCHLEPDRWHGHKFLEATQNAKMGLRRFATFPDVGLPETAKQEFWQEISKVVSYHVPLQIQRLRLAVNQIPWLRFMLLPFVRAVRALRVQR
jgi:2-polyprenyl-3-methyl-5-hydroxy-6-metoxy-1,4-benzoquinol methylase